MLGPSARKGSIFSSQFAVADDPHFAPFIVKAHLAGSLSFIVGSAVFVYQTRSPAWLYWYRVGCVLFIPGCLAYLWAAALSTYSRTTGLSGKVSDVLLGLAMMHYIVGCGMALRGDEREVSDSFHEINLFFLVGSVLAFVDAMKCSFSAYRLEGVGVFNMLDLAATTCFMVGAVLADKGSPFIVQEGMIIWLLGSCFCIVGPAKVLLKGQSQPFQRVSREGRAQYGATHRRSSFQSGSISDAVASCTSDGDGLWTDLNASSDEKASVGSGVGSLAPTFLGEPRASASASQNYYIGTSCDEGRDSQRQSSKESWPGYQTDGSGMI